MNPTRFFLQEMLKDVFNSQFLNRQRVPTRFFLQEMLKDVLNSQSFSRQRVLPSMDGQDTILVFVKS
jgi:hypothetical protein